VLVRHNTSLLEEAVAHVVRRAAIPLLEAESAASERTARAQGFRRLATGAAIALAALGIGLGTFFGLVPGSRPRPADVVVADVPPVVTAPAEAVSIPAAATTPDLSLGGASPYEPTVVTEQFNKFTHREVSAFGSLWTITAGHYFETETDKDWVNAWCYTKSIVDGVSIDISLAERPSPVSPPLGPIATDETLHKVSLTRASALALAAECSWLNGETTEVGEFVSPRGAENPFTEPPFVSVANGMLTYRGVIDASFVSVISTNDFDTLLISSVGGLVDQALEAGRILRASGKSVEAEEDCLSACVFVLAGGAKRTVAENARIGVHRFRAENIADASFAMELAQEKSSEIFQYLQAMGIDSALFHAMSMIPADSMAFLERSELEKWRVISPQRQTAEAWFDALTPEERRLLQSDLTLLGYYQGFVDGTFGSGTAAAISAYQQGMGFEVGSSLSKPELAGLRADAKTAFDQFRFSPIADDRGRSALALPKALLVESKATARGTMYSDHALDIQLETIAKPSRNETLAGLFKVLSAPGPKRSIAYASMQTTRFVVSGVDNEREFYLLFISAGDFNVGYSLSWNPERADEAEVLSMFLASHFFPVDASSMSERAARWAALDAAY
jgi:hypothetical protein